MGKNLSGATKNTGKSFFSSSSWWQTPLGRYVLAWETLRIKNMLVDDFGYNALQLGLPEHNFLRMSRMSLRQIVTEETLAAAWPDGAAMPLRARFTQLPIESQCADTVVLPHVLEFHAEPHQILREVERVLIPEGRLFIVGFNPFSLWGARRRFSAYSASFPWNGRYLSLSRLKDWLKLLGLEVDRGIFGCYAPPCQSEKWLSRWRFMEYAGDRWWGAAGNVYILRAMKRVPGMKLILPAWRSGRISVQTAVTLARKEKHHG
ncbi:MAG: class I SAM-dependent methyltransferase [Zoogloeaceae bacterium]|jgi:SAM-dependent methyltransferase|nr:class I SAM-dependent methyltransferase [Zoogloeaceae bacterium]